MFLYNLQMIASTTAGSNALSNFNQNVINHQRKSQRHLSPLGGPHLTPRRKPLKYGSCPPGTVTQRLRSRYRAVAQRLHRTYIASKLPLHSRYNTITAVAPPLQPLDSHPSPYSGSRRFRLSESPALRVSRSPSLQLSESPAFRVSVLRVRCTPACCERTVLS